MFSATIVSGVFWCLFGKSDTVATKEDCNWNNVEHKNKNGSAMNGNAMNGNAMNGNTCESKKRSL